MSNEFVSNNFITYLCPQKTLNIWLLKKTLIL